MRRIYRRREDLCMECGHLMSKQSRHCPFCGWSWQASKTTDSEFSYWNDRHAFHDIANRFGGSGWQIGKA